MLRKSNDEHFFSVLSHTISSGTLHFSLCFVFFYRFIEISEIFEDQKQNNLYVFYDITIVDSVGNDGEEDILIWNRKIFHAKNIDSTIFWQLKWMRIAWVIDEVDCNTTVKTKYQNLEFPWELTVHFFGLTVWMHACVTMIKWLSKSKWMI